MTTDDSTLSACGYSTGVTAGGGGFGVAVHVDDLTPDEARNTGHALINLADRLTPASPEAVGALTIPLDAINKARGTSHTPEGVAEALGIDLAGATEADMTRIAHHIGGVLMA